jgi:predicted O-methyltransferase YrrM
MQATEDEVQDLVFGLIRALQPDYCIETGTYDGWTAVRICQAFQKNGQGQLDTIEKDKGRADTARALLRGMQCKVIHGDSLEWMPRYNIDFAWLDSETEIRHLEFHRYYPMMTSRTVVAFHDTAPQHRTMRDVLELAAEGLITVCSIPTPRGVTICRVLKGA